MLISDKQQIYQILFKKIIKMHKINVIKNNFKCILWYNGKDDINAQI